MLQQLFITRQFIIYETNMLHFILHFAVYFTSTIKCIIRRIASYSISIENDCNPSFRTIDCICMRCDCTIRTTDGTSFSVHFI